MPTQPQREASQDERYKNKEKKILRIQKKLFKPITLSRQCTYCPEKTQNNYARDKTKPNSKTPSEGTCDYLSRSDTPDSWCTDKCLRVRISPDLSICTAYLSIFPSEKAEELLKNINANEKTIRYDLGRRVHNQLRIIPELRFHLDDSLDYIEHIDELLGKTGSQDKSKK